MVSFEFEEVKDGIYRLVVRENEKILDVMEREDCRDFRTAKIALFSFVVPRRLDFDNMEIDRLLFL